MKCFQDAALIVLAPRTSQSPYLLSALRNSSAVVDVRVGGTQQGSLSSEPFGNPSGIVNILSIESSDRDKYGGLFFKDFLELFPSELLTHPRL